MPPEGRRAPRPHYGEGRRVRKDGYIDLWMPNHPLARKDGYVYEHRLVLADAGIAVPRGFEVHHINKDRADNRLDNLAVATPVGHHTLHHPEGAVVRNQHGESIVGQGATRRMRERKAALGARFCDECGEDITHKRTDAKFCSGNCRIRAFKRQQREDVA